MHTDALTPQFSLQEVEHPAQKWGSKEGKQGLDLTSTKAQLPPQQVKTPSLRTCLVTCPCRQHGLTQVNISSLQYSS